MRAAQKTIKEEELSRQMIKQVLATALARSQGLWLVVKKIGNRHFDHDEPTKILGKIVKVTFTQEGVLIGFAVEQGSEIKSYRAMDEISNKSFLVWLKKANEYAPSKRDYGPGPGGMAKFQCSICLG